MPWAVLTLTLIGLFAWKMFRVGPAYALGFCSLVSLLAPSWLEFPLAGVPLDVRAAATAVGLVIYCCQPKMWPRVGTPWVLADWLMVALGVWHVLSDIWNIGFEFNQPLRALGEWGLPYIAGRQAIQNLNDARRLTNVACAVAMILASLAITESVIKVNPLNAVVGARPKDRTPPVSLRMGFKRAEGTTRHPIWFGMLQFLLFPWTMRAAAEAMRGRGPRWLLIAPLVNAAGVFFTLSRGPMLALALAACVVAIVRLERWRKPLYGVFATLVLAGFVGHDALLYALHVWGGEAPREGKKQVTVVIDEESEEFSSARHRLLVARVYKTAMIRAGLIGFGTEATSTFPVRVPVGVMDAETLKKFWSIDNFYVLFQLRLGLFGVLLFTALGLLTASYSLIPAWRPEQAEGVFLAALGGTIASTMVILTVEWMPADYGFWFLWLCGASSSFRACAPESLSEEVPEQPRRRHRSRSRHHGHRSRSERDGDRRHPSRRRNPESRQADQEEQSDPASEVD